MDAAILSQAVIVMLFGGIIVALYSRRVLTLERDFFITLYLLVFGIYIVLAPALALIQDVPQLTGEYFVVQLSSILFFLVPALAVYRWTLRSNPGASTLHLSWWHPLFPLAALAAVAAFYYIALRNGLFLRRIGHASLAEAQSALSLPELIIYRGVAEAAPTLAFVSCLVVIAAKGTKSRLTAFLHGLAAGAIVLGMGLFLFVNNRMQTLLFGLAAFTAIHYFGKRAIPGAPPRLSLVRLAALTLVALPIAFAVQVARNLALSGGEQDVAELTGALLEGDVESTPLRWRLNGVDLAAKIAEKGLASASWGESYVGPMAIAFNMIFAPNKAEGSKLATRTNVKTVLTQDILGINESDNFSAVITDLYGNFWFLPFPFAGALIGLIFGFGQSVLLGPRNSVLLLLSTYMLVYTLEFEKEFITLVQNLPKFAFIPIFLGLLSPVMISRSGPPVSPPPSARG